MAMLAEPRRRQKIGPNPRGKFFLEDEDNKGRTLLQKLGWQTGNGLGRQNQGMSAPLVPKIQMDSKGLGYDVKNDPWVVHNEEFSNLLGTLEAVVPEGKKSDRAAKKNFKTKGEANSSSEEDSGSGGRKLEKKSKSSRFRIHYHKFIKNKDVSNFSNTDLSCIFGQPTDSLINKTKKSKAGSSNETPVPTIEDPFDEDGVKTINAGSMNDYFNAKMKERDLKAKEQAKEIKPETVENEEDGLKTVNRGSMIDYFKSMMAKRRLKAEADTGSNSAETNYTKLDEGQNEEAEEEPDNNDDANSILIPEEFDAGIEKNKIRELKRKVHEVLEIDENDNETDPNHSEDDRTVIIKSKKSKKDKKKNKKSKSKEIDEDGARSIVENEQEAEVDEPMPTVEELLAEKKAQNFAKKEKRKKSKKRKLVTEVEEETLCDGDDDNVALISTQDDEPKAKKLKKSKKSKKSKTLVVEECEEMMNSSVDESLELEAEVPVKKAKLDKKKNKNKNKKNKHQILEEQQEQSDDVNEDGDGGSGSGTGDEIPDEDGAETANDSTLNDSSSFRKRRPNKKRMSGEELKKLSMTFKGANLHRIRGYAYY